ncbi:DMT family transporter [Actibacterium lipolyticum]|uniref:EamA-like transporter family protein n=1 Tax=Actibacterium lipolyticum TaxID=1524263 RepID=A0A238JR40_9RHOB|nr:DMT family transporter [Actibacterium lipolyticum]SMX33120.1 EamA-like transporter family protein [Actibacterium lipolyticum]
MEIWILVTLAAAAVQTVRFMLQKQLQGAGLSTGGATFSRFLFAAPLAVALASVLIWRSGEAVPGMPPRFWAFVLTGGLFQVVATFALVALFAERNFAVGIAFTKTETVLVALFSAVILGEAVSLWGFAAILVGVVGVILLSQPPGAAFGRNLWNRASALGVLAGACFGVSAIGYRGASLSLESGEFFLRAALSLAVATTSQAIGMAVWLRLKEQGTLTRVLKAWRKMVLVGVTGMLGSLGWFTAFTLQNAAYVRALGQVELVFSVLVTWLVFNERSSLRETGGIALIAVSIIMIVLLT